MPPGAASARRTAAIRRRIASAPLVSSQIERHGGSGRSPVKWTSTAKNGPSAGRSSTISRGTRAVPVSRAAMASPPLARARPGRSLRYGSACAKEPLEQGTERQSDRGPDEQLVNDRVPAELPQHILIEAEVDDLPSRDCLAVNDERRRQDVDDRLRRLGGRPGVAELIGLRDVRPLDPQ
jgi:hypothetical protein